MKLACAMILGSFALSSLLSPAQTAPQTNGAADYAVDATSSRPQSATGYVVQSNVMVTMRDGTRLATDIYRPAHNGVPLPGKFPILIDRSPYNKSGIHKEGIFFAQHGYVVIAQDCRGRFASEGKFYPLLNEGKDGYDAIEWAAAQPWSNGKVGTLGASYGAWTQYTAAMLAPPHLVAMFPVVGGSEFFPYPGGVPSLNMSQWVLYMAQTSKAAENLPKVRASLAEAFNNPNPWLKLSPAQRGEIFTSLPDYSKIFRDMYTHPTLDSYWKQQNFYPAGSYRLFKDVPMYFISGWYDGTVGGVIENYVNLSRMQKSPKRLMIGPWPHATGNATCGDANFGSSAAVDEQALELDWFNHWMKGEPFHIIDSAPIHIFRMGGGPSGPPSTGKLEAGGKWISLQEWPPPDTQEVKFYLQPQTLLRTLPGHEESSSFLDDPADPVPTRGGDFHAECVENQAPLEKRPDVLTFTTSPLTTPTTILGEVKAQLWISSTAPDTDFVAKLSDVYPDGYSMIIAEGQLRARYRKGINNLSLMTPGDIYSLALDLGPTSNLFERGHRIRLDISSTDFPRLEPNPNTSAPPEQWTNTIKAHNTLYFGGRHSSFLMLPVFGQP